METGFELSSFRGFFFVSLGETNTPENRRDIALGKYTHIWISAEAVLGDMNRAEGEYRRSVLHLRWCRENAIIESREFTRARFCFSRVRLGSFSHR